MKCFSIRGGKIPKPSGLTRLRHEPIKKPITLCFIKKIGEARAMGSVLNYYKKNCKQGLNSLHFSVKKILSEKTTN